MAKKTHTDHQDNIDKAYNRINTNAMQRRVVRTGINYRMLSLIDPSLSDVVNNILTPRAERNHQVLDMNPIRGPQEAFERIYNRAKAMTR